MALKFVKKQTEEICLAAIKQESWALQFVKDQTEKICLAAIKRDREALEFVNKNKFPDIFAYYKLLFS